MFLGGPESTLSKEKYCQPCLPISCAELQSAQKSREECEEVKEEERKALQSSLKVAAQENWAGLELETQRIFSWTQDVLIESEIIFDPLFL